MHTNVQPGAYERKERETTMYPWMPSKYKFEPVQFPYKESAYVFINGLYYDAINAPALLRIDYWLVQYTV